MGNDVMFIAKWRARLPAVRATIKTLTGTDTAGIIEDEVLAATTARCDAAANLAAGSAESYTRKEAVGVAVAAAVAVAADMLVQLRSVLEQAEWDGFQSKVAAAAERTAQAIIDKRLAAAGVKPGGGGPSDPTVN